MEGHQKHTKLRERRCAVGGPQLLFPEVVSVEEKMMPGIDCRMDERYTSHSAFRDGAVHVF